MMKMKNVKWWKRRVAPVQAAGGDGNGCDDACKTTVVVGSSQRRWNSASGFTRTEAHQSEEEDKTLSFSDVVDEDERTTEGRVRRVFVGWFVDSLAFRLAMLLVILLNCLVIGIQTDRYLEDNYGAVFVAMDKLFLTIFVLEILVKWYNDFFGFWATGWNVFDFVIVAASILGPSLTFLSGSGVLRILRVLRALRSLKSISALHGLQIVVHTVIHSIPDMANIVALLLIIMFIFSIVGLSLFGDNCPGHFGTLGTSNASEHLLPIIGMAGWGSRKSYKFSRECGYFEVGAVYLVIFITIGAFVFANLVVAVVVTNLEWAIAEQKGIDQKGKSSQSEKIQTVDAHQVLRRMARHQTPLQVPRLTLHTRCLENYFLLLSALEDNLAEFKRLVDTLNEITQEIHALASLEDASEAEIYQLGEMSGGHVTSSSSHSRPATPTTQKTRRFSGSGGVSGGDALSHLISLQYHRPSRTERRRSTVRATNINSLLTQLAGHSHSHTPLNVTGMLPLGRRLPSNHSLVRRSGSVQSS